MAQFKDLIVTGDARILGEIYNQQTPKVAFGTCATAADVAAKVVTLDYPSWILQPGDIIGVKFTNTNTATSITLNVNNTGAVGVSYNTDRPYTGDDSNVCGYAGRTIFYQYDGDYWHWMSTGYSSGGGSGEYLPLSGGTLTGDVFTTKQYKKSAGGQWIQARDNAPVRNTYTATNSFQPVTALKTKNGNWSIGNLGDDNYLRFSYDTDTNYSAGTNTSMNGLYFTESGGLNLPGGLATGNSVNFGMYQKAINGSNTNNYPYRRIAYGTAGTGQYVDRDMVFDIKHNYNGGVYGRLKVSLRTNSTSSAVNVSARWLYRAGIAIDSVIIAYWGVTGNNVYFDVFYKCPGSYPRANVYLVPNYRVDCTLVASNEVADTTTSDKKTSVECYASVSAAATEIRGKAYTGTATSFDPNMLNAYPVNAVYISTANTSPASLFGGTWEQINGYYVYFGNTYSKSSETGTGVKGHTLTANQSGLRQHSHTIDGNGTHYHELGMNSGSVAKGTNYARPRHRDESSTRGYASTDAGWHGHGCQNAGPWDAAESHSHAIATVQVYAWRRTA